MEQPSKIVEAFDVCLTYVFGPAFTRQNPHKSDLETAERWANEGLTAIIAAMVFYDRMNYLHEKYLKSGQLKDRSFVPHSLKMFDDNIEFALRRAKGEEVTMMENEFSKWRSRCKGWLKDKKLWRYEMWGPAPFEKGCRVPKTIMEESPLKTHRTST